MEELVDDFLQHLRNERGQAEHTQKTYAALLQRFIEWSADHAIRDWNHVELRHLTEFLSDEQQRALQNQTSNGVRRLSASSLYLQIAALRAFYRFCETEKLLPINMAENLSLPRRWQR